jgi:4-hydroxyphenylacetate 3-monooxygenase
MAQMEALVEQCMADYDAQGWTGDVWINPGDAG